MRKSSFEKMKDARKRAGDTGGPIRFDGFDGLAAYLLGGPVLPTQKRFLYGREFVRGYKGPAGCAKTSTLACLGWMRALLVPGSKIFVSRADYNDLMDTTLFRMNKMLEKLPKGTLLDRDKSPPLKWWIKPMTVDGQPDDGEVSQFTFMGLKDGLGSLEVSQWLIDEADEVEEAIAKEVTSRFRAEGINPEDFVAAYVFNPPARTHWLYKACTGKDAQGVTVAKPWMTLYEPLANENVVNLPKGYYDRMTETLSPQQKQRLVDGEWGSSFSGQPVFPQFKLEVHANSDLKFNPDSRLIRMWDFGFNRPCCHFTQMSPLGHLYVLRTELGSMEEVDQFALRVKSITATEFPGARDIIDYGDPAVKQHKDTGSTLAKLYASGIQILYRSSGIDEGVALIRILLGRLIDGKPILQFHPTKCAPLVEALQGGYHLDKLGDKPKKDGFYDHPVDAFRYGIINLFSGFLAQLGQNHFRRDVEDSGSLAYDPNDN